MSKQAFFTMKLEFELREDFMAAAEATHRPASQVVCELCVNLYSVNVKHANTANV
jgi:hypothetical protein